MAAKRIVDLTVAAMAIAILSPVFLIVTVVILFTSPGPVLFRQQRLGKGRVAFTVLKFRTMYANAPELRNPDGSVYAGSNDPRVTFIGRFLRKTSLDELPQLFNVVRGEMSLVGPRPDPVNAADLYRPKDFARLKVKPGITGWAQIHGRNEIPWERRRDYDLEYVERQSFGFDMWILLRTIPLVLTGSGVTQKTGQAADTGQL